jgi:hypothetical protein
MGIRGEIFSTKVILQNRTYFFNVKENRMGDLYLNIVESKNRDTGGFERQSVILFAEDLQEFLRGFDDSLRVIEKAFRERKRSGYRRDRPGEDPAEGRPNRGAGGRENYGDRDRGGGYGGDRDGFGSRGGKYDEGRSGGYDGGRGNFRREGGRDNGYGGGRDGRYGGDRGNKYAEDPGSFGNRSGKYDEGRNSGGFGGRGNFRREGPRGEGGPAQDIPARKGRRLVAKKTSPRDKDGERGPENHWEGDSPD